MTSFTRDPYREIVSTLTPAAVSQYLASEQWVLESRLDGIREIWRLPESDGRGRRARIMLPLALDFEDFPWRFHEALSALGRIYDYSAEQLRERIVAARAGVMGRDRGDIERPGTTAGLFWADLEADLEDQAFLREYVRESVRIASVDAILNALDDARLAEGLSDAELARAIGAEPAAVRRLLASGDRNANPTLGTVADLAAALGLRIRLEPVPDDAKKP